MSDPDFKPSSELAKPQALKNLEVMEAQLQEPANPEWVHPIERKHAVGEALENLPRCPECLHKILVHPGGTCVDGTRLTTASCLEDNGAAPSRLCACLHCGDHVGVKK